MSRKIFITGATSGIGRALTYELAGRGYALGLSARRVEILNEIKEDVLRKFPGLQVAIFPLDVTEYARQREIVFEVADKLGGLDIVFANAGLDLVRKVGDEHFERDQLTIETNLLGAMATIDAGLAFFLQQGHGHLVGTSSVAAWRGMPRQAAYCASKAALATYLEAVRAEVYRTKIKVTVLYPGYIDTPLNQKQASRPFLISVEKGARKIADLIEKEVKRSTVPVFPWSVVGRLMKILPTVVMSRF